MMLEDIWTNSHNLTSYIFKVRFSLLIINTLLSIYSNGYVLAFQNLPLHILLYTSTFTTFLKYGSRWCRDYELICITMTSWHNGTKMDKQNVDDWLVFTGHSSKWSVCPLKQKNSNINLDCHWQLLPVTKF